MNIDNNEFLLSEYFERMDKEIKSILSRPTKNIYRFEILDTEQSIKNKAVILEEKQYQMKVGEIWQLVLGNYPGCVNLKNGHRSGLDIISDTRKFAIELKNRTNTDNASSRKSNLDKLSNYKKEHPDYACILGCINADTEKKTLSGSKKEILHNSVKIEYRVGYDLLRFILRDDVDKIIDFVKNRVKTYRFTIEI